MRFDVEGPFKLQRFGDHHKVFTNVTKEKLREALAKRGGLSQACGCYVFATRAGRGYTPHYVGRASSTTILDEALNSSNLNKYNKVCASVHGTPVLFLLPLKTSGGRYRRTSTTKIESNIFLEKWLIASALNKNPALINNKETKFLRKIHVVGMFNAKRGEASTASRKLVKALR